MDRPSANAKLIAKAIEQGCKLIAKAIERKYKSEVSEDGQDKQ